MKSDGLVSMVFTTIPGGAVRVVLVVVLAVAAVRVIVPAPENLPTRA